MTEPDCGVVADWRPSTQAEYHVFIQQFPSRRSSRTGMCEPPQEHCYMGRAMIGRIVLNRDSYDPNVPNEYYIRFAFTADDMSPYVKASA
jgi:hypothetical protein